MNYKIEGTLKKNKKYFIIYAVLWLLCVIVFVMPAGTALTELKEQGIKSNIIGDFIEIFVKYASKPLSSFPKIFLPNYFLNFINVLWKFTVVFLILAIIGIIRNSTKSEYEDIEHGSSDWSKNGEQYKILSNKKGIILGENNYLPVDKRGNVNVLVVGRFWFW